MNRAEIEQKIKRTERDLNHVENFAELVILRDNLVSFKADLVKAEREEKPKYDNGDYNFPLPAERFAEVCGLIG